MSSLSQLGPPAPAAAMMPPHGSYEITSSPHPLHHHIPYGAIIRSPSIHMPPHIGRMTNDLGPPIFMPCKCNNQVRVVTIKGYSKLVENSCAIVQSLQWSALSYLHMSLSLSLSSLLLSLYLKYATYLTALNLGVPKPPAASSTSQANSSGVPSNSGSSGVGGAVSTTTGSKTKSNLSSQPSMNTPPFMTELMFQSAFHPAMRTHPSGQGHASYIPVSAPPPLPPPSTMNMKHPTPQSLSSSSIAKPTPIPASAASHNMTSSGIIRPTPKSAAGSQAAGTAAKQPVSAASKGVTSSGSKGEIPSANVNLIAYGYPQHIVSYGLLNAASAPPHGQLSKMLLGGSQQQPHHPPSSRSVKSDGSSGSSKAPQGN